MSARKTIWPAPLGNPATGGHAHRESHRTSRPARPDHGLAPRIAGDHLRPPILSVSKSAITENRANASTRWSTTRSHWDGPATVS